MTSHHDNHPPDPLAARLRAALTSEADMVNPSDDGLQRIRGGVDSAGRPWWRHPAALAVAAAAVLGLAAGGVAVALSGGGEDGNVVAGQTGTSAPTGSPSPTTPAEGTGSASPVPIEGNIYVYYAREDDGRPRLYREERPSIGASPVVAALSVMLAEPANDPDYSSLWPEGTGLDDVQVSGGVATVSLSDFPRLGAEAEAAAVAQLVYTVTANDKSVTEIGLLVDGKTPPSGRSDWSEPVGRAPMVDVQGLVWLLGPTEGETVSSPVAIDGYGTAFEGTISWEVRKDGEVVADGFTQGGSNGEFGEFSDTVTLEPGSYEIRAFESSAEDGRPLHVDTKTFTVD